MNSVELYEIQFNGRLITKITFKKWIKENWCKSIVRINEKKKTVVLMGLFILNSMVLARNSLDTENARMQRLCSKWFEYSFRELFRTKDTNILCEERVCRCCMHMYACKYTVDVDAEIDGWITPSRHANGETSITFALWIKFSFTTIFTWCHKWVFARHAWEWDGSICDEWNAVVDRAISTSFFIPIIFNFNSKNIFSERWKNIDFFYFWTHFSRFEWWKWNEFSMYAIKKTIECWILRASLNGIWRMCSRPSKRCDEPVCSNPSYSSLVRYSHTLFGFINEQIKLLSFNQAPVRFEVEEIVNSQNNSNERNSE